MFQPKIDPQVAQTLRDIEGGGSAVAYMSELRDAERGMLPINRDLSLADLERMNLANEQSRVMNPLEATIKGAAAREAAGKDEAYFSGIRGGQLADAKLKGTQADIAGATKDTTIAHTNAKNQAEQRAMLGKEITERAAWMASSLPPSEYVPALTQFASKIPGMTESPQFQALIKQPPEKILQFMQKMGDTLRAADPALRNADRISAEDNITKERVANIGASATRYAADARKKDADAEMISKLMVDAGRGNAEAAEMLARYYAQADNPEAAKYYKDLAIKAALRRENERRQGSVGKPDMNALGIPTQGSNNPYRSPAAVVPILDLVKQYANPPQ